MTARSRQAGYGRRAVRQATVWAGALALVVMAAPPATAYPRPGQTERVSVNTSGFHGNRASFHPTVSADGRYVTFMSDASNLVPDDTNRRWDIFVRDQESGTTERVSVASDGTQGNGNPDQPAISADGRYVAYHSAASNLVQDDTNRATDIFVRDRASGTTERVSVASDGTQATDNSFIPAISADGRYVAFHSLASNLAPGDTNGSWDVFVRDRVSGTTERVSLAADGGEGNGDSSFPAISADGRHVAFESAAANLVPGDDNNSLDIFVRDRVSGTTERVSVATGGAEGNAESWGSWARAISADGHHVTFRSLATNLVPGDTNGTWDVFVRDRVSGTTERVSVAYDGAQAAGSSVFPAINGDGRYVAFQSGAANLVPGDTNGRSDMFVHDRVSGTTERVSVAHDGAQADGYSGSAAISADGRHVAFHSVATNLVRRDTNGDLDVFVRDRGPGVGVGKLSALAEGDLVSVTGWATFSGQVVASVSDPPDDGAAGAEEAGAELIGASLTYRAEQEDFLVKLHLASLPGMSCTGEARNVVSVCEWGGGAAGSLAPGVLHRRVRYVMGFEVDGTRYEVRARSGSTVRNPLAGTVSEDPSHYALYRCDPDCTEQALLAGGIGTTGAEVRVAVPLSDIGAATGTTLTRLRAFTSREDSALEAREALDEAGLPDAPIPAEQVALGIAPAGTPESEVTYPTRADLEAGRFSGTVDVSSLAAGDYRVWARACLGDRCGATPAPVTLSGGR